MQKFYSNKWAIFIFSAPTLILFTLFVVYPLFPQINISLQKHNGIQGLGYVGLQNYRDVLADSSFWRSLRNTFVLVFINLFMGLPLSLILALVLNHVSNGVKRFFKTTSFLPAVLSVTVLAQMWVAIYQPRWGILNAALEFLGLDGLTNAWLSNPRTAIWCIGFAFLWQYIGQNMMLFYTGLMSIPETYYEAALIDGATAFQTNIRIILPLLQDNIKFLLVISVMGCLRQFEYVEIMTNGGPGDSSRTVVYQLYYTAFRTSEFGKGCAVAVLFILIALAINIVINATVAREKIEY